MSDEKKAPPLPLDKRFVQGRVVKVGPDLCDLELDDKRTGRLHLERCDEKLRGEWGEALKGRTLPLFLLTPADNAPSRWNVSQLWGKREENPWVRGLIPRPGEVIEGSVIRYVADYAAIVQLDGIGVEAFLHAREMPFSGHVTVPEVLFIGDRVRGKVVRIDGSRLQIEIDLNPVITEAVTTARAANAHCPGLDAPVATLHAPTPHLPEVRLWVIDDSKAFREGIATWLSPFCGELLPLDGELSLANALDHHQPPTHLILDYGLEQAGEWRACLETVRQVAPDARVAMCSTERPRDHEGHPPFIDKGRIDTARLIRWLEGEELPDGGEAESADEYQRWRGEGAAAFDFRGQAEHFLATLCRDRGLSGALWAERTRPHYYEPIASYGLKAEGLAEAQPFFGQTIIGNTIELGQAQTHSRFGRLGPALPPDIKAALGISLSGWKLEDHAVVLFSRHPLSDREHLELQNQAQALAALIGQREMAEYLHEVEPFAAPGRFALAFLHEIQQAVSGLLLASEDVADWVEAEKGPLDTVPAGPLRERLRELQRHADHLYRTNDHRLDLARRRTGSTPLLETVRLALSLGRGRARALRERPGMPHEREPCLFMEEAPAEELHLKLDAQVITQPLLNLFDNALHHLAPRGGAGRVAVRILLRPEDPEGRLLWIEVEDNGPGIDALQQARLFQPRTSTRGREGVGMGLYLSRKLVESAGGKLELAATPRFLGTTFRLRLPLILTTPE